jgi:hypothetical protein
MVGGDLKKSCIIGFAAFYGIWNLELFSSLLSDSGEIDGEVVGKVVRWLLVYVLEGMNVVGWVSKASWYVLAFSLDFKSVFCLRDSVEMIICCGANI